MKHCFLYNPLAGKGKAEKYSADLKFGADCETVCTDMTKIEDMREFIKALDPADRIIICGGDGTLNRFVNKIKGLTVENEIIYLPAGSGNDFAKDLNREDSSAFKVNEYITGLPCVTINNTDFYFLNGVGFGIDGLVCSEGDRLRSKGKRVNYTLLAVKCLAMLFKPVNATVTVDGVTREYKKVWMTTTMKGKFFGGGMKVAPNQDRNRPDGKISVLIAHNLSKLKILTLFPSIFKGEHVKYKKHIELLECDEISVEYDRPCALQMDGEPIQGITGYYASAKEKVLL